MKVREIRPGTTYVGHGGFMRKVTHVSMDITGAINVTWKAVKLPRTSNESSWASQSIEAFAKWALTVTETLSDDLRHYVEQ